MTTSIVSTKYQIVIPKAVRRAMRIRVGKRVTVQQLDDHRMVISTKEESPLEVLRSMRGLGKEVWDSVGGVDAYIDNERNSWDK